MTCGNDGHSFSDFLEQASKTVAGWPKWKRDVLGDFPGSQDPALFAKEIQKVFDRGGEGVAQKTSQEDLKIRMAMTDRPRSFMAQINQRLREDPEFRRMLRHEREVLAICTIMFEKKYHATRRAKMEEYLDLVYELGFEVRRRTK